jgi:hypothetical protein
MRKSVLTALISMALLAQTGIPVAIAATAKTQTPKKVARNRSSGRRRARNVAIGTAGGAAGGAILGRGRGRRRCRGWRHRRSARADQASMSKCAASQGIATDMA